jgi:ketosteroid isomerase-like protein
MTTKEAPIAQQSGPWDVRALADRLEIEDLATKYMDSLDGGDIDGFVGVFTQDAEIRSNEGDGSDIQIFHGHAQIREFVDVRQGAAFHCSTDSTVTIDGDTAVRNSRWIAFPAKPESDGTPVVRWIGRGTDEVVRTPEGWRIAVRHIIVFQAQGL